MALGMQELSEKVMMGEKRKTGKVNPLRVNTQPKAFITIYRPRGLILPTFNQEVEKPKNENLAFQPPLPFRHLRLSPLPETPEGPTIATECDFHKM